MAHMHAGYSPAEVRKIARQIERAAARNPVPHQYRVRFRAKADAPLGAWAYLPSENRPHAHAVFSSRKDAETAAKHHLPKHHDVSITCTSTEGY